MALSNGKVFAWGYNSVGQLGDGTNNNSTVPVRVSGLTGIAAIASGGGQTLAVRQSDGQVFAWGYNSDGQLGDGTTINRSTPVLVSGLTNVVRVAAGAKHSLALKADGTVWAWGHNYDGEIGDGTTTNRLKPVLVTGLSNVVAIAAGAWHSLALKSDGTVWAWGYNYDGELGNETNVNRWKPVHVNGLTHIAQIAAHGNHNLALENDSVATSLSVQAGAAAIGTKVTFMATLTRADSHALLSGENVLFALDGIPIGPHLTNSNGVAAVSYSIPESLLPGSHSLVADFSGDSSFGASQGKLLLTVAKGAVTITVPDVTGSAGSKVTLQATLKNSVATGLAQRTLKFIVNGVSVGSAATNANGQASLIYTIPTGTSPGKQTVQATFSGGSLYKDGTGTGKLTIQ